MSSRLSSLFKRMKQQQQQQQQQQQAAQTAQNTVSNATSGMSASDTAGLFTSKRGAPATSSVNPAGAMDEEQRGGLFGNLRKQLFAGGVSSGGGVFSFGNRRQNKKGGLFNLFG